MLIRQYVWNGSSSRASFHEPDPRALLVCRFFQAGWNGAGYTFTSRASPQNQAAPIGHVFSSAPGRLTMGRSNYMGVAGDFRPISVLGSDYRGLMYYQSKNALAKVPDGTSNTFLFGEMCGGQLGRSLSGTSARDQSPPAVPAAV